MKKLLITSALFAVLATPTLAFDLGRGFVLDNTVTAEYSVETEVFTTLYEAEVNYAFDNGVLAYAQTEIDLQDVDFNGLDLGLEYVPAELDQLTLTTEVQFDSDLNYSDVVLTAEVKF